MIGLVLAATVLVLSAGWLMLISSFVIPLIVGLTTKLQASKGLKGVLTLVLAAVAGVLQTAVASGGIVEQQTLINGLMTFGGALLVYYGLLGPAKVDEVLAPQFGLGKATTPPSPFDA